MCRCEDVQVRMCRCEDVRCEDVQVRMCRCEDVYGVKICRCVASKPGSLFWIVSSELCYKTKPRMESLGLKLLRLM